jgi:hypothetical protein
VYWSVHISIYESWPISVYESWPIPRVVSGSTSPANPQTVRYAQLVMSTVRLRVHSGFHPLTHYPGASETSRILPSSVSLPAASGISLIFQPPAAHPLAAHPLAVTAARRGRAFRFPRPSASAGPPGPRAPLCRSGNGAPRQNERMARRRRDAAAASSQRRCCWADARCPPSVAPQGPCRRGPLACQSANLPLRPHAVLFLPRLRLSRRPLPFHLAVPPLRLQPGSM